MQVGLASIRRSAKKAPQTLPNPVPCIQGDSCPTQYRSPHWGTPNRGNLVSKVKDLWVGLGMGIGVRPVADPRVQNSIGGDRPLQWIGLQKLVDEVLAVGAHIVQDCEWLMVCGGIHRYPFQ